MTSYTKARKELAQKMDENRLPCRGCGNSTLKPVLSRYGGRCVKCFEAYCAQGRKAA